ncbi:tetratricopeptide repeat protein, partial [bacterium]|nr:tetratricopeptide repeat protein [bacterium]
ISYAVGNMGIIYIDKGDFDKAMECYEKELKIAKELGDKIGISQAVGNMGIVYALKGDYDKAMDCFEQQLKIAEELGDKKGISRTVGNMGNLYAEKGDYDKAMKCYEKALQIGRKLDLKPYLTYHLSSKTKCLYKMKEYEKAIAANAECLEIAEELKDEEQIIKSKVLSVKINFALAKGDASQNNAISELQEMLSNAEDNEQKATLNYELWKMKKELTTEHTESTEKSKETALVIYRRLYKKTPIIEYKNRIKELEEI